MPRYEPNSRFSDCWSSVGDTTFFHIDGVCYWKKKPVCEFAGTPGQMEQLELHRRALAAWQTLDHDVQLQWNTYAVAAPSHKPPFDGSTHITGHNLFVSAYHGFAQLSDEHVPEPAPWEEFPLLHLKFSSAVAVGDSDLQMTFRASLPECSDPTRYRVVAKLLMTEPGHTRTGGFYRTFLALSNCPSTDAEVRFIVPDFHNLWPISGPLYQVHCRYLLIDTENGYRNIFRKASFLMEIE